VVEEHPPQYNEPVAQATGEAPADFVVAIGLLEILVCPVAKTVLEYDRERRELISRAARLAYPIRDGVPIMLPEEARVLDPI
jgi:uncharacterized protein